jgi:hypothetical protein
LRGRGKIGIHAGAAERWLNKTLQLTKLLTIKKTRAMKTRQSKQSRQDRQANFMIAVAIITGIYFVLWALIGIIL